ncbi:MAG: STAS domain-containing protein [Gammaproteobacteria bacterium]|jgi:anti-anti-sigma factor
MATVRVSENENTGTVTISISERFDFYSHKEFRASYKDRCNSFKYVIDLRDVKYIDSSALGMMLLLREHAQKNSGSVTIANCNPQIRKILQIANFGRLFEVR